MCGLYRLITPPEKVRERFGYVEKEAFAPRQVIRPGEPVGIVWQAGDGRWHWKLVLWGLVPHWMREWPKGRRMINARAETLLDKPMFRGAVRHRRCLVVADGFHEWTGPRGAKRAVLFTLPDERVFAMAGLWERWQGADGSEMDTMAIITVDANVDVAPVHERMPALLRREHWSAWLDVRGVAAVEAVRLLQPAPAGMLKAREVGNPLRRGDGGGDGSVAGVVRDAIGGAMGGES